MNILYSKSFKKQYSKLSKIIQKTIQNKVINRLELFMKDEFDPILNNHKLHTPWEGDRSINIYRRFKSSLFTDR